MTGTTAGRVWVVARKAAAYEWNIYRSLFRWVARRPAVSGPGARGFGYAALITPVLVAFVVVSAIELPILHLVLPWEGVRLLADIAGVWGLIWMLGLMASVRAYPHVVSDAGLRIRSGSTVTIDVPWDAVAAVRRRDRTLDTRGAVVVEETDAGRVVSVAVMKFTNIDVVLREPTVVAVPGRAAGPVAELRFSADDPGAVVAEAGRHLVAADEPIR